MYRESVGVPMIAAVEDIAKGACETPVTLLDLSETIPRFFGLDWVGDRPGRPLQEISTEERNPEREIISQYHAVGAVSGSYMLRRGKWKYIEYAGFEPELFDLEGDPEEIANVAAKNPDVVGLTGRMLRIVQWWNPQRSHPRTSSSRATAAWKLRSRSVERVLRRLRRAERAGQRNCTPVIVLRAIAFQDGLAEPPHKHWRQAP